MRPVSRTVIQTLPVSIERVVALLTDPSRMAEWLPGCAGTQSDKPLRKGVRFKVRFGERTTEFEVVDFMPPTTFGWVERGERNGWKTFFRLDPSAAAPVVPYLRSHHYDTLDLIVASHNHTGTGR